MALVIHMTAWLLASISFANIKTLIPKNDEIIEIKTALGIATIIQIPETIQSAIMGDQSAYRIEYVDHAVTIKPLRGGAKTNLYLFTKEKRYNFRLSVVPQNLSYYIVYIKSQDAGTAPRWLANGKVASNSEVSLKLLRTGKTTDNMLLLDLEVTARKSQTLQANSFWIWQGRDSKVIQSLFLSRKEIKKDQKAFIGISIQKADLRNQSLFLELQTSSKPVTIEIPREVLWN